MSFLAHHCRNCGHAKHVHLGPRDLGFEPSVSNTGAVKNCTCCGLAGQQKGTRDFDPNPTLHETRSFATGNPEPLIAPGGLWNAGTAHQMRTCSCVACEDFAKEVAA